MKASVVQDFSFNKICGKEMCKAPWPWATGPNVEAASLYRTSCPKDINMKSVNKIKYLGGSLVV